MTTVAGPAGPLRVDDAGAGEPAVLLVHGLVGRLEWWAQAVAHLRAHHRVVAFDLHGHGESPAGPGAAFTIESFAADVLAVADALGLARFVLVGHSLGASVALAAAARAPGRVAGLVLVDAAGVFRDAPPGALEQFLDALRSPGYPDVVREAFLANLDRAAPATRATVLAGIEATPRATVTGAYESLLRWDPHPALAAYGGPRLLVVDADNESTFSLHAQAPSLPRVALGGVSHWLQLDHPQEFHDILDRFLAAGAAHG